MNIQQMMLLILTAALSAALLYWLHKSKKIDKWLAISMFIALQLVGNQVAHSDYLSAGPLTLQQQIGASLDRLPVMVTLKEKDPATRQRLENAVLAAMAQGMSKYQALELVQPEIAEAIGKRLPFAPDAQINQYMAVTLLQLNELQDKGGKLCFQFLFPHSAGAIDATKYNSASVLMQRLETDNRLVAASYQQPQTNSEQDLQQASAQMQHIALQLARKYGDDLKMLTPPQRSDVDHQQVCRIVSDLYQRLMALPAAQSAALLRIMLRPS